MSLDTRFIPLYYLQEVIVDKTTGAVLSGGTLSFYSDINRNVPKQVYMISGTPPNYQYTAIGTQVTLSSVGTPTDGSGNDIAIYVFPYDGTPATTTNTLDLYYIVAQNSSGTQQWTREGVPNLAADSTPSAVNVANFAANGQFLLHNDNSPVPGGSTIAYGGSQGTMDVTTVAPGGWTFERTTGGTFTDTITFPRLTTTASQSPRFAIKIVRTGTADALIAKIGIRFMDVMKFSGNNITFLFTGFTSSGSASLTLYEIDYFGTNADGSLATATQYNIAGTSSGSPVSPVTVTTTQQEFALNFTARNNVGTTLGTRDNDFVQFALVLPASTAVNVTLTDFMIVLGNAANTTAFPVVTNGQFVIDAMDALAQTTSQPTNTAPNYYPQDGSNLYLPVVMTPAGFTYDYSVVGTVYSAIYSSSYAANLPVYVCDGSIKNYATYSSIGIPNSRLGALLISDSPVANTPKYGTGTTFATVYAYTLPTSAFRVTANSAGVFAAASDGSTATGFTFTNVNTGAASINYNAYSNVASTVLAVGTFGAGTVFAPFNAATSGFTLTLLSNATGLLAQQFYAITILCTTAAALANPGGVGKYFQFSNASTTYYMWFRVTLGGTQETDPAPGGTGIMVNLQNTSTATAQDVANIVREAINKYQVTSVVVSTVPPAGSFFQFVASSGTYFGWYQVAGLPTSAPSGSGTGIKIVLVGTETAAQVVTKTLTAINAYQYAVPDFRGMFLRGLDAAGTWDTTVASRWSTVSALSGANLATFEFQQFLQHTHVATTPGADVGGTIPPFTVARAASAGSTGDIPDAVATAGGSETRPVNTAVNFYIRY